MTTVHKKRHGGIRRWFVRNSLTLALIGIILLSMTAGAIGCLAFLPKPQNTSTPETKTDVSTATVMQPDIMSPSLDPIPEPQVFYFDVPLSEELQDYIREKCSEYKVPMELVIALIDKESSFRSDVVSTTNDYGFTPCSALPKKSVCLSFTARQHAMVSQRCLGRFITCSEIMLLSPPCRLSVRPTGQRTQKQLPPPSPPLKESGL